MFVLVKNSVFRLEVADQVGLTYNLWHKRLSER